MIIGITGHRPNKLGGYNNKTNRSAQIKARLIAFFKNKEPTSIVSGMAIGVDQWSVEVALELGIKVTALIPCAGQDKLWPQDAKDHYQDLLGDIIIAKGEVIQLSSDTYNVALMHARNKDIIDRSDILLAVWDGSTGGTGNCVNQAKKVDKIIFQLHPQTLEIKQICPI